jgi:hypothetical protein
MNTVSLKLNASLLRLIFILGPSLLVMSSLSFVLGIGLIPPGISSYVEGIFGSYALVLFAPIYLFMGNWLWNVRKTLGATALVTGLLGSVVGFGMEFMRVVEFGLRESGATDQLFSAFYQQPAGEFLIVALCGPLFPLTSIILGAGFLGKNQIPTWASVALIAAGIFFPLAQVLVLDWALKITYPLATIIWLIVFGWIAVKKLN